jgi:hypothetical protein
MAWTAAAMRASSRWTASSYLCVGSVHHFEQLEGGALVQFAGFRVGLLCQQPFKHVWRSRGRSPKTVLYTEGLSTYWSMNFVYYGAAGKYLKST